MRATGLAALGVLIGCSGSGNGNGNGKPFISTSKDNFCDQIAAVACYDLYQCCAEGEIERFLGVTVPRTNDQCRQDMRRLCVRNYVDIELSIAANRAQLDSTTLNACLNSLVAPDKSCATPSASTLPWTTGCSKPVIIGTVGDGSACFHNYECAVDSYCPPNGTCTALPTDGMACAEGRCASSATCSFGTCRALAGSGGACTSSQQCLPGLFCDTSSEVGQCAALHEAGDKCSGSQSCKAGSCVPGTCAGNNGITCFGDGECPGYCSNGQPGWGQCHSSGQCATGYCSVTPSTYCNDRAACPAADETCVFPAQCVHNACLGSVCVAYQYTADYCSGALAALPLPPG